MMSKFEVVETSLHNWGKLSKDDVHIVIAGKRESGKSALAEALCDGIVPEKPKGSSNQSYNIKGFGLTVWDSCGLQPTSTPTTDSDTLREVAKIEPLTKIATSARSNPNCVLLYTIPRNQNRFPITDTDDNADLNTMKSLTIKFGKEIWNNAIIVVTRTNKHYEMKKRTMGANEEERKKTYTEQEIPKFEKRIKDCMSTLLFENADVPENLRFVPAGYVRHPIVRKSLECDPVGESWIFNIWHKIIEALPANNRYSTVRYCFARYFQEAYLYCDSFLSFVSIHHQVYKEIPKENETQDLTSTSTGDNSDNSALPLLAFSFLRLISRWFEYYQLLKLRKWTCSPEHLGPTQVWKGLKNDIKIIVTGESSSGKTSLINSLLYGKKKINEIPHSKELKTTITFETITFTIEEYRTNSLPQESVKDAALLIICIQLDQHSPSTRITLNTLATQLSEADFPKNCLLALTFADNNTALQNSAVKQTTSASQILREAGIDCSLAESLPSVAAGYHKQEVTVGEPAVPWKMNFWLETVASADSCSQPALCVFLNQHIYGGKARDSLSSNHLNYYRKKFLPILHKIMPK